MARKLKTYQTSLGFFDEAIAAPSMKAALEAWGTKTNLFHQGVAKEVDDPDVIAATLRKRGVILKRPQKCAAPAINGSAYSATQRVQIPGISRTAPRISAEMQYQGVMGGYLV